MSSCHHGIPTAFILQIPVNHYNNVTCTSWRLKSPAKALFVQPFVHAHIKENIKALHHWPKWWQSKGNPPVSGFPSQTVSNAEKVSISWRHPVWHHCDVTMTDEISRNHVPHQSFNWWPVNSPHKETVKREKLSFDDVIVRRAGLIWWQQDFEWWWSVPLSSASLH